MAQNRCEKIIISTTQSWDQGLSKHEVPKSSVDGYLLNLHFFTDKFSGSSAKENHKIIKAEIMDPKKSLTNDDRNPIM